MKAIEVSQSTVTDLRLLQHDLRDPDPVGRRVLLPRRQILAPVAIPPAQQSRRESRKTIFIVIAKQWRQTPI